MTGKGNRERCPACGRDINEHLGEGSHYHCPKCKKEFVLRWNKAQRDYQFMDMADKGKGEPLRLPKGSVRSLITLVFSGTLWALIVMGRDAPSFLLDTILIVFGYYFALRTVHSVYAGPTVTNKDQKEPLNMPKGSIRWILIAGFAAVLFYAFVMNGGLDGSYVSFYFVLGGIILGYILSKATTALEVKTPSVIKHILASFVLIVAGLLCLSVILGFYEELPDISIQVALTLTGFYFGSR
jgi:predicted RNA-binding Zn-ribbon protein involved in translation (DUF1610 family)